MQWPRFLLSDNHYRLQRLRHCPTGTALHHFLSTPFPDPNTPSRQVPIVAIDLETTGLKAKEDDILSIGLLHLNGEIIELQQSLHLLVRPAQAIPEPSAIIHGITDTDAAAGLPLEEALNQILPLIAGRVMLAHHAAMELNFIGRAIEIIYGCRWIVPVIDTEWLARRQMQRRNLPIRRGDLRLATLRQHAQLPLYRAHNALSDALATAELFLVQREQLTGGKDLPLKRLLYPRAGL
ncbi:3'-5' exonuclease [Ectothiorhodospiraceae bacterium BW-2]|nr:3'-5' exonuclease [Ectothiorhodospiraceae bacterium BW-2]